MHDVRRHRGGSMTTKAVSAGHTCDPLWVLVDRCDGDRLAAYTPRNWFTSSSAIAQMLHGLVKRISPRLEMGVGPKPMAMASPSGQNAISPFVATARAPGSRS